MAGFGNDDAFFGLDGEVDAPQGKGFDLDEDAVDGQPLVRESNLHSDVVRKCEMGKLASTILGACQFDVHVG